MPARRVLLSLLALGWMAVAGAQTLRVDPTLPPPGWMPLPPPAAAARTDAKPEPASGLQMILVGKSRRFAIIGGQVVKPGDTYNGSQVVSVRPGGVVMQDASKSLQATPGVVKKMPGSAPPKPEPGTIKKSRASAKTATNGNGGRQ